MKIASTLAVLLVSSSFAVSGESARPVHSDCRAVAKSLRQEVNGKSMEVVLKMLSKEVASSSDCACELIKAAIAGYKPTPEEVSVMVEAAITAAPHRIKEIVNCGIAAAPDAKSGILDTAKEYGYTPNPLDFPGIVGEHPLAQLPPVPVHPIIVNPPQVTPTDP